MSSDSAPGYVLGLDFGGTKLAAGLVELPGGVVCSRARRPTPPGGAEAGLAAMLELAAAALADAPVSARRALAGVGVSFGGPVEIDGRTVRYSMHVPGWRGLPLAQRIEAALGVPARVANDADAAALAEHRFGAGRGARTMLYLTVSTGIGGGVVIDGRLHRGERAWAGEVGHMLLQPDGPPCPCGRNGCLESLASGWSIVRAMYERLPRCQQPDPPLTAADIARAAAGGDPLASSVWEEAMVWLGIGVASAANLLNPGRVVLGGGLTNAGDLLFAPVRRVVAARALDPELAVLPAALGNDIGVLAGAVLLT